MSTTVPDNPLTAPGAYRDVLVVPAPSCPTPFAPKHSTAPVVSKAHVNSLPADTAEALALSATAVGVAFSVVVVFCPN
jgi:hypothetical protein